MLGFIISETCAAEIVSVVNIDLGRIRDYKNIVAPAELPLKVPSFRVHLLHVNFLYKRTYASSLIKARSHKVQVISMQIIFQP